MPILNYATDDNSVLQYARDTEVPSEFYPSTFELPTTEPVKEEAGEFVKGFQRGVREIPALAAGTVGLLGDIAGIDTLRDWGYDQYVDWMKSAGEFSPAVASIEDIEDVDTFLDWFAGTAGSVLPSVIGAVGTSGLGAAVGVAGKAAVKGLSKQAIKGRIMAEVERQFAKGAASHSAALAGALEQFGKTTAGKVTRDALMRAAGAQAVRQAAKVGAQAGVVGFSGTLESGGNWIDDFETNGDGTNPVGDLMFGIASGLTDLVGAEGLALRKIFGPGAVRKLASEVGEEAVKNTERAFGKALVRELSKNVLAEGGQEALQESLGILNSYMVAHSIDAVMTPETFSQVLNAAAAGGVGGLAFGVPQGLHAAFSAKQQADLAASERERKELEESLPITLVEKGNEYNVSMNQLSQQVAEANQQIANIDSSLNNAAPGDAIRLAGQRATLSNKVKELTDAATKLREKINDNDTKLEASRITYRQKAERRAAREAKSKNVRDWANSQLTSAVESMRVGLKAKQEAARKSGLPNEEVSHFDTIYNKIVADASKVANSITLDMAENNSYEIEPFVRQKLADIKSTYNDAIRRFKKTMDDAAGIDKDTKQRREQRARRDRAFTRGIKDSAQEELADGVSRRAAAARERQMVRDYEDRQAALQQAQLGGAAQAATPFTGEQRTLETFGGAAPDNNFTEVLSENKKSSLASKFKLKSVKEANTINDVAKAFAKKLSGKNMPFTYAEAKLALDALLPRAMNLDPAAGAKYLRDNLVILTPAQAKEFFKSTTGEDVASEVNAYQVAYADGEQIIGILNSKSKKSFLHEVAHVYLDNLQFRYADNKMSGQEAKDFDAIKKWVGWNPGQEMFETEQHEKFARGFEQYLLQSKAPNSAVEKFFKAAKQWVIDFYRTANALNISISPAVKRAYDNMFTNVEEGPRVKIVKPSTTSSIKYDKVSATKKTAEKVTESTKSGVRQAKTALTRATKPKDASYVTQSGELDWTWADSVKEALQDYYHPLRLLVKAVKEKGGTVTPNSNVWAIEEAVPNRTVEQLRRFDERHVQPMIKYIQAYAKRTGLGAETVNKHINQVLHAQHAKERNAVLGERGNTDPGPSGMTDKKADEILAKFAGDPDLSEIAKRVVSMGKYQLKLMEDYQLIPQKLINKLKAQYKYYVPLKGWEDFMKEADPTYKDRAKSTRVEIARALGRSEGSAPASPLVHMIKQTMDIINVSERVRPERALLNLIRDNKNVPGMDKFFFTLEEDVESKPRWTYEKGRLVFKKDSRKFRNEDYVFSVTDTDGTRVQVRAADKHVYRAFTGNNLVPSHPIIKLMGKLTRAMAKLSTTLNPAFILTNPIRDVATALVNITDEKLASKKYRIKDEPIRRTIMGLLLGSQGRASAKTAIHNHLTGKPVPKEWREALNRFRAEGGFSEQYNLNDFDSLSNKINASINDSMKNKNVFGYTQELIRNTAELLEMHSNSFENMTRLATFKALSDAWISKGMPREEAWKRAASAARNITVNFSKRGAWGPVLSPLFMFSNASIQSTARMFKTIMRNKTATATILGTSMGSLLFLAEMNRWWGGDDDDGVPHYDKVPDWVKNNNFVIMLPGGNYVKIPMPYGYNVFNVFSQMVSQVIHGRKNATEATMEVINSAFDNFSPVGSPEAGWTTVLPTVLRPPFQVAANRGFFGQKILPEVPTWIKREYPDSQRYWSSVSTPAKWLAQSLNAITGGSEVRKGLIDISPETIEHFVESYGGGLGKLFDRALNTSINITKAIASDGSEMPVNKILADVPAFRRFYGVTNFYSTLHEYNKLKGDIETSKAEWESAKTEGRESIKEFKDDNPNFFRMEAAVKYADKRLRKLRRLKNSIMGSKRAGQETARLEKIRAMEEKLIKQMIKQIRGLQ